MKKYHKCKFCKNPIVGGDVVIHETGEHSHPLCYRQSFHKKPKSNSYFNLFERGGK